MDTTLLTKSHFEKFIVKRNTDLKRISRRTRNEYELSDVIGEAWIMAHKLRDQKGVTINFLDKSFQDLLIRHLYQHLVRYTEKNVRYATRIDQATPGSDREEEPHWLMRTLVSEDGQHPLTILLEQEHETRKPNETDIHHSLAGAYIQLLRIFDNRMRAVSNHLLISVSYAYRRCAHARLLITFQKPLSLPMIEGKFIPGPWRRFRLQRTPVQLKFNFDEELRLE